MNCLISLAIKVPPHPSGQCSAVGLHRFPRRVYVGVFGLLLLLTAIGNAVPSLPGWTGNRIIPVPQPGLSGWTVESDSGSSGTVAINTNSVGTNVLQFNWNIGSGNWTQARFDFSTPYDASNADIFGVTFHGGNSTLPNTVSIMFADAAGVTFGYDWIGQNSGLNQVNRWLYNLPLPKNALSYYWGSTNVINWAQIKTFWLVVKRSGTGTGGGSGTLLMDGLVCAAASTWPRATNYVTLTNNPGAQLAASNAVTFIRSAQNASSGLFLSWQEDPSHAAWLYDQATALIILSREGIWNSGVAANASASAADKLWAFLGPAQKNDGTWSRGWNVATRAELSNVLWVGDQAWIDMALVQYADKSSKSAARTAALKNAQMLATLINPQGSLTGFPSTEGTVDTWWAMIATKRFADASKIAGYLLSTNVWDSELRYWREGLNNPAIAVDCANWLSAFARYPSVGEDQRGLDALSFVRNTLLTASDNGQFIGLDGQGPVSLWNEGMGQYVAAGGTDAQSFLDTLLSQQTANGSMPGSPDNWTTDAFGWLTSWHGIAPTAWLYFAVDGLPFPQAIDSDGDGMADWAEYVAGTDPSNALSVLKISGLQKVSNAWAVSWQSVTNRTYYLQRGATFASFSTVQSNLPGQAGTTTVVDASATNGCRFFYRVGIQ